MSWKAKLVLLSLLLVGSSVFDHLPVWAHMHLWASCPVKCQFRLLALNITHETVSAGPTFTAEQYEMCWHFHQRWIRSRYIYRYCEYMHRNRIRSWFGPFVRRPRTTSILQTASNITIFAMCEAICSLVEDTSMLPNRSTWCGWHRRLL